MKKLSIIIFTLFGYILSANPLFAQIHPPIPGDPLGLTPGVDYTISQHRSLETIIVKIINFALGFVGTIALIMFLYGGFLYLTSAGDDTQSGNAKKTLLYAVIGIIVIMISYAVVFELTSGAMTGYTPSGATGSVENFLDWLT